MNLPVNTGPTVTHASPRDSTLWCEWHDGWAQLARKSEPDRRDLESVSHVRLVSAPPPATDRGSFQSPGATSSFPTGGIAGSVAPRSRSLLSSSVKRSGRVRPPASLHPALSPSLSASPPPLRYACVSAPNANELLSLYPPSPPLLWEISQDENSDPHCLMTKSLRWLYGSDEVSFIRRRNGK